VPDYRISRIHIWWGGYSAKSRLARSWGLGLDLVGCLSESCCQRRRLAAAFLNRHVGRWDEVDTVVFAAGHNRLHERRDEIASCAQVSGVNRHLVPASVAAVGAVVDPHLALDVATLDDRLRLLVSLDHSSASLALPVRVAVDRVVVPIRPLQPLRGATAGRTLVGHHRSVE